MKRCMWSRWEVANARSDRHRTGSPCSKSTTPKNASEEEKSLTFGRPTLLAMLVKDETGDEWALLRLLFMEKIIRFTWIVLPGFVSATCGTKSNCQSLDQNESGPCSRNRTWNDVFRCSRENEEIFKFRSQFRYDTSPLVRRSSCHIPGPEIVPTGTPRKDGKRGKLSVVETACATENIVNAWRRLARADDNAVTA
jgi:hypothetical protein